jgi:molybdopterin-biosynthesis enzyme MoeA-like protein
MKRDIFEEMMAQGMVTTFKAGVAKTASETFGDIVESFREAKLSDKEIYDLLVYTDEQMESEISKAIDKLDV